MKAYVTIASGDINGPEGSYTEQNQYRLSGNQEEVLDVLHLMSKVVTRVRPVVARNKTGVFLDLIVKDSTLSVTDRSQAVRNGDSWSDSSGEIGIDSDDDSVDVELVNSGMIQHKRIEDIMNVIIDHYEYSVRTHGFWSSKE